MEMHPQSEMVVEVDEENQFLHKQRGNSSIHAKEVITIKRISHLHEIGIEIANKQSGQMWKAW